jgi:hypothetical protein
VQDVPAPPLQSPLSSEVHALLDQFVSECCVVGTRLKETTRYLNEAWLCFTSEKNVIVEPSAFGKYMNKRFKHTGSNFVVHWADGSDKGKGFRGLTLKADVRKSTGLGPRGGG